jgi:site-specific recombinase XerD
MELMPLPQSARGIDSFQLIPLAGPPFVCPEKQTDGPGPSRKGLPVMAQVFRPVYTVTNAATGKRLKKKSRTWHVRYYTPDGQRHRVKGYRDRKATETLAAELERRGIRVDAGLVDPADIHAKRPLAAEFRRYLAAKGDTEEYVAKMFFRLTAVLDGCRFTKIADVQSSAVVEFLGTLRSQGKSVKTANDCLAAAKGFARWLWRDKRSVLDPLAGLSKLANEEADVRHARRDFSPDELCRLLEAAGQSTTAFLGLTGTDRRFLYLTACATGFRVSELASMTPDSFALDGDTPTAKVEASCTKNRKEAAQPLPLGVVKSLRDYLANKAAGGIVWPGNWVLRGAAMIRGDLEEARKAWLQSFHDTRQLAEKAPSDFLAYRDSEGRYADFHALRHSFITMVGKAGVSPREHQDLARHSTYALTSRYSHSRFYDLAAAVQSLPIPTAGPGRGSEVLSATGTDGKPAQQWPETLSPDLSPCPASPGDFVRQAETESGRQEKQKNPENKPFLAFSGGSGENYSEYPQGDSNPCLSLERAMS